jgi:hypothetical protein
MESSNNPPESIGEDDASTSRDNELEALGLSPLPLAAIAKSEHVPPVIIKESSFLLDFDFALGSPSGGGNPPFTHRYPFPFGMRGIRVIGNPFGTPETLYYNFSPDGCRIEVGLMTAAGGRLNFTLASVISGATKFLELTTHDHALPTIAPSGDPDRPHRYLYASDTSVRLDRVAILDSGGRILFQGGPVPGRYVGIWRAHE